MQTNLQRKLHRWIRVNRWVDRLLLAIVLTVSVFTAAALVDNLRFLEQGIRSVSYHSFTQLKEINRDTVAWLSLEGTHIDHPVVQGEDNFEYLDKAFQGESYAGGTLFLDAGNRRDFSDTYQIIHGHHMAGGAMFGDLQRFLDAEFLRKNHHGLLLTPSYDYDLQVLGAVVCDAYDPQVYAPGSSVPEDRIASAAAGAYESGQILALSTCSGVRNDDRIVVFCQMVNRRKHG